jgi:hypothetical protein
VHLNAATSGADSQILNDLKEYLSDVRRDWTGAR